MTATDLLRSWFTISRDQAQQVRDYGLARRIRKVLELFQAIEVNLTDIYKA